MKRILVVCLGVFVLAACSSSPSPVLPPKPLSELGNTKPVELLWSTRIGQGAGDKYLRLEPVFADSIGFGIDARGTLVAFDSASGRQLWERELNAQVSGGISLIEGSLFIGTSNGKVIAVDPSGGKVRWSKQMSSEILAQPVGQNGIVVVRSVDGNVYGLDAETGDQRWVYDRSVPTLTLRGISSPVVENGIVVVGMDNGRMAALTINDGTVLWETTVAVPRGRSELERIIDIDADPVIYGDEIYVVSYQGRIACVQFSSGRILWVRDMSSYAGIAVDPYRVFISGAEGNVWALDRFNGSTLWKQEDLQRRALTGPALVEGHVVVDDYAGYLHWISRENGHEVARERMAGNRYFSELPQLDDEDVEDEVEQYTRTYNILSTPLMVKGSLVAMDRRGYLAAYRLLQN